MAIDTVARGLALSVDDLLSNFITQLESSLPFPSGRAVEVDVTTTPPTYTYDMGITTPKLLGFQRAGTGVAMSNGETVTAAIDEVRIVDGKWFISDGGTNVITAPSDISNAAWTVLGLDKATIVTVPGEGSATSAHKIFETTGAASGHQISNRKTGLVALTKAVVIVDVKSDRDYIDLDLDVATSGVGVRIRVDITTGAIVAGYPAALMANTVTNITSQPPLLLASGLTRLTIGCQFNAAVTELRTIVRMLSAPTTSIYVGDITKTLTVERVTLLTGTTTPTDHIETVRVPEIDAIKLPVGFYLVQTVDALGTITGSLSVTGDVNSWSPRPRTGGYWLSKFGAYVLSVYDDTRTRADTTPGTLGTRTDGGVYSLLAYNGSYPMIPSVSGQLKDGWFVVKPVSGRDGTVYLVCDLGPGGNATAASCDLAFDPAVPGDEVLSNTSGTILFSNSFDRLIEHIQVHNIVTRSTIVAQYRATDGTFVTLGALTHTLNTDGSIRNYSVVRSRGVEVMTFGDRQIVITDPVLAEPARYACFEIQCTSNNTTDHVKLSNFRVSTAPVPVPAYIASVPINREVPIILPTMTNYNAAQVFTILNGSWDTNNGQQTFTHQWKLNGTNISTAASVDGAALGFAATDVLSCVTTSTNLTGASAPVTVQNTLT